MPSKDSRARWSNAVSTRWRIVQNAPPHRTSVSPTQAKNSFRPKRITNLKHKGLAPSGGLPLPLTVERGVRFVQLWSGAAFGSEVRCAATKPGRFAESGKIDQPVAALLRDLRQRGMLDDTLVIFNTEFGRTPYAESAADKAGPGRDHNADVFSVWLAGAGLKHGIAYGASDDIGWKTAANPGDGPDFHATILHLLGIAHERLTFYHNGIQRRLTNVRGNVLTDLLA